MSAGREIIMALLQLALTLLLVFALLWGVEIVIMAVEAALKWLGRKIDRTIEPPWWRGLLKRMNRYGTCRGCGETNVRGLKDFREFYCDMCQMFHRDEHMTWANAEEMRHRMRNIFSDYYRPEPAQGTCDCCGRENVRGLQVVCGGREFVCEHCFGNGKP